ncbi:hypothetical protein [Gramella sp. KN1008]|uniref:hypothetical protein n=1 Tax=Gramella sp. KN1008 TaxID=2529298 RepID=UPI00103C0FC9|nr:hypothetical protein [Gramella sp. KN1008]TBW28093.1 hypothetical protein EZJ28_10230 [Gramella sp. KN1008]
MKNISLLLVMLFLSFGALAQVDKNKGKAKGHEKQAMMMEDPEPHAMMYADKMATRLSLNAEQKEKIKKAQLKRLEAQKELMADHMDDMADEPEDMADERANMHKQRMKIQDDFKEEMKEILTESQYTKWEVMHEREMKMHKGEMKMEGKKKGKKDKSDDDDTEY